MSQLSSAPLRNFTVQSRRFECNFDFVGNTFAAFQILKSIPSVTYIARNELFIYIETDKKKASSFISRLSPLLSAVQICSSCALPDALTIEKYGTAMRVVNPSRSDQKYTQHEELFAAYTKIRTDGAPPDFTGNVGYMVNRDKYDSVMSQALFENAKAAYELRLLPWQKKVIQQLEEQNDRTILWVFDYNGNSGKTELGRFLLYKMNFQILTPGRTHDLCGLLNPFANGYVFDCPRDAFSTNGISRINEMFGILEDIKNRYLISGKYKGATKIPLSHKVVVFANQLPNLEKLSMDRWNFFHTRLGSVGVNCCGFKDDLYSCQINRENIVSDVKSCHKLPEPKTDKDAITEYLTNYNVPGNLRLIASNSLAFPNAKTHAGVIYRFLRQHRYGNLLEYLEVNDCLKDSITTIDVLLHHFEQH